MNNSCYFVGRSTLDMVYVMDQFPEKDAKFTAHSFFALAGGPALNAAITYAFLGSHAKLISEVGVSTWASQIHQELKTYKVDLTDLAENHFIPPISAVIVDKSSGGRTILNVPKAIPRSHPKSWFWPQDAPQLMLVDGFLVDGVVEFLRFHAQTGSIICLDGGSWKPVTRALLPFLSIAICSENFIAPGEVTTEGTIRYLLDQGIKRIAITRGEKDIIGAEEGKLFSISVPKIEAVDTLGAGDIFHGAFCWFFQQSKNFQIALKQASVVAALSCQFLGTREWMKHWDQKSGTPCSDQHLNS